MMASMVDTICGPFYNFNFVPKRFDVNFWPLDFYSQWS